MTACENLALPGTLKLLSYTTMLLYRQIHVYENHAQPRSLVPCRSEVHKRLLYIIRLPYSNHVVV